MNPSAERAIADLSLKDLVKDLNKAISLKPDYADAYYKRGLIYLNHGNKKLGCLDEQKACALGACATLEAAKGQGYCR